MIGTKEFNKKIGSLKNTRQMTKTMKMVSASKFKRAYKNQSNAQAYAQRLKDLMVRLSSSAGTTAHPLMKSRPAAHKALVVLFTSDKGLCGGFNNNLIRHVRLWLKDNNYKHIHIGLSFCGRRGWTSLRKTVPVEKYYEGLTVKPDLAGSQTVAEDITGLFKEGKYDAVYLACNRFRGPLSQEPVIERILPLTVEQQEGQGPQARGDYLYEPPQEEIFALLVPKYLEFKIYYAFLENAVGEHEARMVAMDHASKNTGDLIDRYTLLRNRARQAAITTELIEIISGAEALK
jgi:F-type H+-transporting ATPase subunit gamma